MGTLSLAAPLVLFEKSRLWAGTEFHLLPSFHHHPAQHNYTTQTVTHTVTLTSTSYNTVQLDTLHTRNVVCPSGAWFENRPHLTPSIHLAWNPKRIIVQCVGIGTHTLKGHKHVQFTFPFQVTYAKWCRLYDHLCNAVMQELRPWNSLWLSDSSSNFIL